MTTALSTIPQPVIDEAEKVIEAEAPKVVEAIPPSDWKWLAFLVIVGDLCLYTLYTVGNVVVNHVYPDGIVLGTAMSIIGGVAGAVGYHLKVCK